MAPVKVLHIITSLHSDGAQNMLYKIAKYRDPERVDYQVVSLLDEGVMGAEFEKIGVKVHCLRMKSPVGFLAAGFRLRRVIKSSRPAIIQAWMYHANLIALLAKVFMLLDDAPRLIWNIRRDLDGLKHDKLLKRIVIRLNSVFSYMPSAVIFCGEKVAADHESIGFDKSNQVQIPNGFSCEQFAPSVELYHSLREELGIDSDSIIVGMVARFHYQKDHENFVRMAAMVLKVKPQINFVLAGEGCSWENSELVKWIEDAQVRERFHLLGRRSDVAEILAGFDVFCLSSSLEGFPNVLGEAMASGVICVSTAAGAAREIVADDSRIAPIKDPVSLSRKVIEVLNLSQPQAMALRESSRRRVVELYKIENVSKKYQELYERIGK